MIPTTRINDELDRSSWGEGPWENEPDYVEWIDAATGLSCLIRRIHMGHLCGYVGVGPDHPFFREGYTALFDWSIDSGTYIDVHGGLTYAGQIDARDTLHWFGFDCGHCDDLVPLLGAHRMSDGTYRDVAYVTREVTKLAAQLKKVCY